MVVASTANTDKVLIKGLNAIIGYILVNTKNKKKKRGRKEVEEQE